MRYEYREATTSSEFMSRGNNNRKIEKRFPSAWGVSDDFKKEIRRVFEVLQMTIDKLA
jgi:hypothetical protein